MGVDVNVDVDRVASHGVFYPGWQRQGSWAKSAPTALELEECDGNWKRAERGTCEVGDLSGDLNAIATEAWGKLDRAWEQHGRLLMVGFSNGCIVATEYATLHQERCAGLLLLSGLPAALQEQWIGRRVKYLPDTVIMTVGSWEGYFGGLPAFQRVATVMGASLIHFAGGHCKEDT